MFNHRESNIAIQVILIYMEKESRSTRSTISKQSKLSYLYGKPVSLVEALKKDRKVVCKRFNFLVRGFE